MGQGEASRAWLFLAVGRKLFYGQVPSFCYSLSKQLLGLAVYSSTTQTLSRSFFLPLRRRLQADLSDDLFSVPTQSFDTNKGCSTGHVLHRSWAGYQQSLRLIGVNVLCLLTFDAFSATNDSFAESTTRAGYHHDASSWKGRQEDWVSEGKQQKSRWRR